MLVVRTLSRRTNVCRVKSPTLSHMLVFRAEFSVDQKPVGEDKPEKKGRIFDAAYFQELFTNNRIPIMAAGSVATVVGVSNALYAIGDNLLNLTSSSALYYGFSVGSAATVCAAVGVYFVERSFRIEPEAAVALTMAQVRKNHDLMKILGSKVTPSEVKTYAHSSSGFGVIGVVPKLFHPKIQIAFSLVGGTSPALVSAVFHQEGLFGKKCDYVGVNWTSPAGANMNLTLVGDDAKFTMKPAFKEHASKLVATRNSKL
uniref:Uncharacterized protein n=1 Tax=Spumella elongata TaxID=89044 RepID=A0A7S3GPY5_9STRA